MDAGCERDLTRIADPKTRVELGRLITLEAARLALIDYWQRPQLPNAGPHRREQAELLSAIVLNSLECTGAALQAAGFTPGELTALRERARVRPGSFVDFASMEELWPSMPPPSESNRGSRS